MSESVTLARRASPLVLGWKPVAVVGALALLAIAFHIFVIPIDARFYGLFDNATDLFVYRAGGQVVLDGKPLYEFPVSGRLSFTYPPFSAVVFTVFALMTALIAKIVWWAAIFAALVLTVYLGMRTLGYRADRRLAVFAACAAVCVTVLEPVRTTIWLGQINVFLMFLILLDLVFLDLLHPRSRLRGIGVGIAAGLKLTPAFFVVYLLVLRRWRAAAMAVVAFGVTVAVGYLVIGADAHQYWTTYMTGESRIGRVDSPANQSVNGFMAQILAYFDIRRFSHPAPGGPLFSAPDWLWVPVALVAAILGLWAAVVSYRRGRRLLSVSIAGMTAATVSPFSWGHHWVWVVPLLVVAFDFAYRGSLNGRRYWWRWLAPLAICALSFSYWWNYFGSGPHYRADHIIAIGLFMMPRYPDPGVLDRIAVILYSGCYPLILLLTIIVTLAAEFRARRADDLNEAIESSTSSTVAAEPDSPTYPETIESSSGVESRSVPGTAPAESGARRADLATSTDLESSAQIRHPA
ncbi:glycosyltransferase 87 family protein [Gordonia aichiensis]